ncbi:MAG: ATP-binding cassette domain-containing protein [Gammaproteobacteria bacterium]|nr:ATP-binding cassette domain-containing protein [Gammaproteobacteria bacterium]NNF60111.1 ATP-binding cassette domain-containing protein [Gammaproteobacteria bacterium]NNM21523.1 ATP-binding cassette domain-containing protein [Gammaproteobacteria bacterium]
MIEAQHLAKSFGAVQAVRDVSFSAADGRITGLLGPNGAGKSTTLRMLYTVLKPDSGTATIGAYDVVQQPLLVRQNIGVLPHSAGLYPNFTGRQNIAYYAALHGFAGDAREQRVSELIERLGIADYVDRKAKGFSHGQRTRVALARALIHDPRNVLLDEPTSGLDVMATRRLRDLILALRDAGCCVLLSSHVMQEVAALCDRIIIIGAGKVVAAGTPDSIRQQTGREDLEDAFVQALESAAP